MSNIFLPANPYALKGPKLKKFAEIMDRNQKLGELMTNSILRVPVLVEKKMFNHIL